MPVTNVIAKVKKINLDNKVIGSDWRQAITLTLGEIELTDANLIALRKFRPDEDVLVNLKTMQLAFGEAEEAQRQIMLEADTDSTPSPVIEEPEEPIPIDIDSPEENQSIIEGEPIEVEVLDPNAEDDVDPSCVLKSFSF